MSACCPPGHGCNAPNDAEPCALELCRAAASEDRDAALAVARWDELEHACGRQNGDGEPRFRRRAYERTRDRALISLAMRTSSKAAVEPKKPRAKPAERFRVRRRAALRRRAVSRA
jgi:hypothetical protein